jgi:hypothetical protein
MNYFYKPASSFTFEEYESSTYFEAMFDQLTEVEKNEPFYQQSNAQIHTAVTLNVTQKLLMLPRFKYL